MSHKRHLRPTNSHEFATTIVPPAAPLALRAYLAALGRMGGQRTSDAKRRAARANGKRHKGRHAKLAAQLLKDRLEHGGKV